MGLSPNQRHTAKLVFATIDGLKFLAKTENGLFMTHESRFGSETSLPM